MEHIVLYLQIVHHKKEIKEKYKLVIVIKLKKPNQVKYD